MKKLLLGTVLAAGLMATGAAQADTEDALVGGMIGLGLGIAIANDDDHHHHRPVHYYHAPPRHVYHHHHHPRGHAYGYWRNHGHHRSHFSGHRDRDWDRRDWDRRGRHDGDRHGRR
jgi:hypothetical protein